LTSPFTDHDSPAGPADPDREARRFQRRFDRLERRMPGGIGRRLRALRRPDYRLLRFPLGVLLLLGGLLWFLPVLGLWMLPFGLLLLAVDLPFLKGPVARTLVRLERRWQTWKRRRDPGRDG